MQTTLRRTGTRQPLPRWLQRGLAAGVTLLLWVATVLANVAVPELMLEELNGEMQFALIVAPALLPLAALLRPWSLLMRLSQPLAPRFATMAMLWPSPLWLLQRNALVQALGWASAVCIAAGLLAWLPSRLWPRLIGSTLEGLASTLSLAAALGLALPLGLFLHRLPRRWALARLAGQRDGAASSDALALAANLMPLLAGLYALNMILQAVYGVQSFLGASTLLAVLVVWWLHAGLRQWLAGRPPEHASLWLVVLPQDADASTTTRSATNNAKTTPADVPTLLALAHQLAGRWQQGPVTVLLPDTLGAGGEHLRAAQLAGRAAALFPTLPVQLADWKATLPPRERWAALPLRELHLPRRWMAGAAAALLQPQDRLLVLAGADVELSPWQPLLRGRPAQALRLGQAWATEPRPVLRAGERSASVLKAEALALLQPLWQAPPSGSGDAESAPTGEATTVLAQSPAMQGLPALPNWARLRGVVAVGALLAVAVFVTLRLQLNARADTVAGRYAALQLLPAAATAAEGGAPAGTSASTTLLSKLAPDITNGLLTVAERPDAITITMRSDALFESGTADLAPAMLPSLDRLSEALRGVGQTIMVNAHTDNQPHRSIRYPSNAHLSSAQADSVRTRLLTLVSRGRVVSSGRADSEPVASNDTAEGRAANRRIELIVAMREQGAPRTAPPATAASAVEPAEEPPAAPASQPRQRASKA
jgi:flagellar motor protein MotB